MQCLDIMGVYDMSELKHTPGPWSVQDGDRVFGYSTGKPYSHCLHEGIGYKTEREANARLIAAAPDLLTALQDIVDAYQKHFDAMPVAWQTYDNIARAAIAKATGETL